MSRPHVKVTIENVSQSNNNTSNAHGSFITRVTHFLKLARPFFNVDINEIPLRIMSSLVPPIVNSFSVVHADLVGPLILSALLNLILFLGLISKDSVSYPTALSKSFHLSFGYWICLSVVTFALSKLCKTCLKKSQILAISGYSLSGHVIALLLGSFYGTEDPNHSLFLTLTAIFGGLSVVRFALILLTRTPKPAHRLVLCTFPSVIHLLHLIYCYILCIHHKSKFSIAQATIRSSL